MMKEKPGLPNMIWNTGEKNEIAVSENAGIILNEQLR
jgi:hypothetical protein